MNVAEWIIVGILSATLFIFLIVGTVFFVKAIKFVNHLNCIAKSGQDLAEKANHIADSFKGFGAAFVGGVVNALSNKINKTKKGGKEDDNE